MGPFHGARLRLRYSAQVAVHLATDQLVEQGFVVRADGFDQILRAQGSPWTAVALELGDAERSNRMFWINYFTEDLPFPMPKFLQPSIAPTLVVATARTNAEGMTELVIYPHSSRKGDSTYAFAARPRVTAAIAGVVQVATAAAALESHEVMRGIANDGCPASQAVVRSVLKWR